MPRYGKRSAHTVNAWCGPGMHGYQTVDQNPHNHCDLHPSADCQQCVSDSEAYSLQGLRQIAYSMVDGLTKEQLLKVLTFAYKLKGIKGEEDLPVINGVTYIG